MMTIMFRIESEEQNLTKKSQNITKYIKKMREKHKTKEKVRKIISQKNHTQKQSQNLTKNKKKTR